MKVQFHGKNSGQTTAGKVSKQISPLPVKVKHKVYKQAYKCRKETVNAAHAVTHALFNDC